MNFWSRAIGPWIGAATAIAGATAAQPAVDEPLDPWRHPGERSAPLPSVEPGVEFVDPWGGSTTVVYRPGELLDPWEDKSPRRSALVEDPYATPSAEGPALGEREFEPVNPWPTPPSSERKALPPTRADELVDPWPGQPLAVRSDELADPWPDSDPPGGPHSVVSEPPSISFPPVDETADRPSVPALASDPEHPSPSPRSTAAFPRLELDRAQP